MYRYAIETRLESFADLIRARISLVAPEEFFNVDLSALSKGETLPCGMQSEENWVKLLYKASGMYGLLTKEPGVSFKPLEYWTAPPPHGPGIPMEEVMSRFLNLNLTTTMGEIENLLNANLCTAVSRPDGGLHVLPLVPYANARPSDFVNGQVPVLYYQIIEQNGVKLYKNDPKLDVGELKISLDNSFAVVEVEGYSNVVSGNLVKSYATFVQGGQETKVLRIDAGLWDNDAYRFEQMWNTMRLSNGMFDDPTMVQQGQRDFNVPGFRYTKLDNGVPKRRYYPEAWYRAVGLVGNSPDNFEVTTGDVNYEVVLEKVLYGKATNELMTALSILDTYNQLPENVRNTFSPDDVVLGFRAYGRAKNICGSLFGDPFYTIKVKAPEVDSATLVIKPLVGEPSDDFAPKWFEGFYRGFVLPNLSAYPRKKKRVENPFVGEMASSQYAVQASGYESKYTKPESLASHLATWLTFNEFLKTRSVSIRYAGIAPWKNKLFIGIAIRPPEGENAPVRYINFFMLDNVEHTFEVNGEAWTTATAYFLFRFDLLTQQAVYTPSPVLDQAPTNQTGSQQGLSSSLVVINNEILS